MDPIPLLFPLLPLASRSQEAEEGRGMQRGSEIMKYSPPSRIPLPCTPSDLTPDLLWVSRLS